MQKEAAETHYWIELLIESEVNKSAGVSDLLKESTELLAIFASIGKKLKQ